MTSFIVTTLAICTFVAAAVFAFSAAMHLFGRNYRLALYFAGGCALSIISFFILGALL